MDKRCKLCASDRVRIIYEGVIRTGGLDKYTEQDVPMFQCENCGVIWHDPMLKNIDEYYESKKYRASMDEGSEEEVFYRNHDRETLDKLQYTGTTIFRDRTVADIGCGAGAFLDFLKGVAKNIVAIEPSEAFQKILSRKGFAAYSYTSAALTDWENQVDTATSFDVIEHVEDPLNFMCETYKLLSDTGTAIIGTPTDAPLMRKLLGECYEKQILFSTQHLWIFSGESLKQLAKKAGFSRIEVRYFQRYGLENLLGWCIEKRPKAEIKETFFRQEMDAVWKSSCSTHQTADYVVLYAGK